MIVCSCNVISCRQITSTVDNIVGDDPMQVVTAGQVYRALGFRPRCGGCLNHATNLINARVDCHRAQGSCPLAQHALTLKPQPPTSPVPGVQRETRSRLGVKS